MITLINERNKLLFKRTGNTFIHFFSVLFILTPLGVFLLDCNFLRYGREGHELYFFNQFFIILTIFKLPVIRLMFYNLREEKDNGRKALYFKLNGFSKSTCTKYNLSWFFSLHSAIFLSAFHYKTFGSYPYWLSLIMYILYHLNKVSQTMFLNLVLNDSTFCLLFTLFSVVVAPFCYFLQCSPWALVIISLVYPDSCVYFIITTLIYYDSSLSVLPQLTDSQYAGFSVITGLILLGISTVLYFILSVAFDYYALCKTYRQFTFTQKTNALYSVNSTEQLLSNNSGTHCNSKDTLMINKVSVQQTFQSKQLTDINMELNVNDTLCILGYEDKTTLLKIIAGELAPHSGEVVYKGFTFARNPEMFVHNILYVSHSILGIFKPEFSLYDNLLMFMKIYNCSYTENDIDATLKCLSLLAFKKVPFKELSEENKIVLLIACAACSGKQVILFDEAFTGLSIASRIKALEVIRLIRKNKIIVIGTTTLGEMNYIQSKIAVMKEGRLLCLGSKDSVKSQYQFGFNLKIKFNNDSADSSSSNMNDVFTSHKLLFYNIKTILPSAEILYNHKSVLSINFFENNIESINQVLQMFEEQPSPLIEDISLTTRTMKEYFFYNNCAPGTNWLDIKDKETVNEPDQNEYAINDEALDNRNSISLNKTESILSLPKSPSSFLTQLSIEFTRHLLYFLSHKAITFITMFYCFCGPLLMLCSFNCPMKDILSFWDDYTIFNMLTPFHLGLFIYSLHLMQNQFTDRTNGFKTIYCLSKGSVMAYLAGRYVYDFLHFCLIMVVASPFLGAVDIYFFKIVIHLLVYVLGFLPFIYVLSCMFKRFYVAVKVIPIVVLAFVPLGLTDLDIRTLSYVMPQLFCAVGMTFERFHISETDTLSYRHHPENELGFFSLCLASAVHFALYWIILVLYEFGIFGKITKCCKGRSTLDNFSTMMFTSSLKLNIKPYSQTRNQSQFANANIFIPNNGNSVFKLNDINTDTNNINNDNTTQNNMYNKPRDLAAGPSPNALYSNPNSLYSNPNPTIHNNPNMISPNLYSNNTTNFNYNPPNQTNFQYNSPCIAQYNLLSNNNTTINNNSMKQNKNNSIILANIKKKYATCSKAKGHALINIFLCLEEKEGTCMIGLPGSGKSTLFKLLVNETTANDGIATIFNKYNLFTQFSKVKDCIGYTPETNCLPEGLTISSLLLYYINLMGYQDYIKIAEHLLKVTGLYTIRNEFVEHISNSDKRKLHFVIMILKNPELLLLDTPTVGIEPSKQMEMWNTIERIKASKDVNENFNLMLISNDQYEIDTLSDSITVIKHGTVLYKECNEKVIKDYAPGYNVNVLFEVNEMDVGTEQYENIYNDLALLMERSSNALRAAAGINPSLSCRYIMLARFLSEIKESSEKIILKEIKNDFSFTYQGEKIKFDFVFVLVQIFV